MATKKEIVAYVKKLQSDQVECTFSAVTLEESYSELVDEIKDEEGSYFVLVPECLEEKEPDYVFAAMIFCAKAFLEGDEKLKAWAEKLIDYALNNNALNDRLNAAFTFYASGKRVDAPSTTEKKDAKLASASTSLAEKSPSTSPVILTKEELEKIKRCNSEFGPRAAAALRETFESEHRLMEAAKITKVEQAWNDISIKIPKIKDMPFFLVQIFFLLFAVYDATQPAREISFDDEELSIRANVQFDQDVTEFTKELHRLEEEMKAAKDSGNSFLQSILNEKEIALRFALSSISNGKPYNIDEYKYQLKGKTYKFKCAPENYEQVKSAIRRWRLSTDKDIPDFEAIEFENFMFKSRLPEQCFNGAKYSLKSIKEDVIMSVISLRQVAYAKLMQLASAINQLPQTIVKVTSPYEMTQWPEWVQKLFSTSKSLNTAVEKAIKECNNLLKKEKLTKEEKIFFDSWASIPSDFAGDLLRAAGVSSSTEFPEAWKMAIAHSSSVVDKIAYLRQFVLKERKPENEFEVTKPKEEKKTKWADIVQQAPKPKRAPTANYVPNELIRSWNEYNMGVALPAWLGEAYMQKPETTVKLVELQLARPALAGIQNSKFFKQHEDGNMRDFYYECMCLDFVPSQSELPSIRAWIDNGSLSKIAQATRTLNVQIPDFLGLSNKVFGMPAKQQKSTQGKPAEGKKGGAKPKPGGKGKKSPAADGKAGGKAKPKGPGKQASQPKPGKKEVRPKPGGSQNNKGQQNKPVNTKSVNIGGKSISRAEVQRRIKDAKEKSIDFIEINGNRFGTKFLGRLVSKPDVVSINSRFKSDDVTRQSIKGKPGNTQKAGKPQKRSTPQKK